MTTLPPALARLVQARTATLVQDIPCPHHDGQRGRSAPVRASIEELLDPIKGAGTAVPIALEGPPFGLAHLPGHPKVVLLLAEEPVSILRGSPLPATHDRIAFDTTDESTSLLAGRWLLDVEEGHVRLWQVELEDEPSLAPSQDSTVEVPDWPGLDALLAGLGCPEWLRARIEVLVDSPDPVDRLVAAGLLVRLWQPRSRPERAQALQEAMAGDPQPQGRVREWLARLEHWSELEAEILDRVTRLLSDLEGLVQLIDDELDPLQAAASQIVADRDDLASLEAVVRLAGHDPTTIAAALSQLDLSVAVHGAILTDHLVLDPDSQWLQAVRSSEPEHWWGQLLP